MQIETFADINGFLNKDKNPFIEASDNFTKITESNISISKSLENKYRIKYGPKDPIYYYYVINDKTYKYTCKKKMVKIYCHFIALTQAVLLKHHIIKYQIILL